MTRKIKLKFKKGAHLNNAFLVIIIIVGLIIYWQKPEIFENLNNEDPINNLSSETAGDLRVERIIDGDTFVLTDGRKVRLIGIDTPERGEYFFDEATEKLDELISGKILVLKKDISETDRYGRILRHIYVDDIWINKQMIEMGYAQIATFPPDVAHVEEFTKAEREARENKLGLWK